MLMGGSWLVIVVYVEHWSVTATSRGTFIYHQGWVSHRKEMTVAHRAALVRNGVLPACARTSGDNVTILFLRCRANFKIAARRSGEAVGAPGSGEPDRSIGGLQPRRLA